MIHEITRRRFLAAVALGTGSTVLAACAPKAAPTVAPAAAPKAEQPTQPPPQVVAKEPVELRLHVRTGTEEDTLTEMLPILEQEQDIKVKVEAFPGGEYYQKLQVLIAGDQAGDVWWNVVFTGQAPLHAAKGILLFLDDLVEQDNFALDQYYEGAIATCYYEGNLIGLPFKLHPGVVGLYYNTVATEEAGLGELKPESWEELVEIGRQLTKKEGDRTIQFGYQPAYRTTPHFYFQMARAWGGDILSQDGTKAMVNEEPFIKAMEFVVDMIFREGISPSEAQIPEQAFPGGVMATIQSGSWDKSLPTRVEFEVKNALLPKGPGGKVGKWMVTDVICGGAKTKHVQESWELIKLLCGQELGIRLGEGRGGASGTSGGRKDVFESSRLLSNPLHPIWVEAVSVPEDGWQAIVPANLRGGEYNDTIRQRLAPLWTGDAKPDKPFFDDVNKALQEVLDKPMP
jgi:multiple sugar transport system substrate-binding protein